MDEILIRIVKRAGKLLGRSADDDDLDDSDRSLAQAYAAAATARGTEKHAPDEADDEHDGQVILPTRRKARIDGFDLDAEVAVRAHERDRLEYLCRYILRPPRPGL